MPECHERVRPAALVNRQNIDRHAVDGDILGCGEGIRRESNDHQGTKRPDVERREGDGNQAHGQTRLREQHPRSAKPHREKRQAVHERTGNQLERPGDGHDGREQRDLTDTRPLFGEPRRHGDRQQPDRDTLGKVECAERAEPKPALFAEGRRSCRGSGSEQLFDLLRGTSDHRSFTAHDDRTLHQLRMFE